MFHYKLERITKWMDPILFSNCTGACFSPVFGFVGDCFAYWLHLLGQTVTCYVDIYCNTLFSAVTNSKYSRKEFKYEAFIKLPSDIFLHLPVSLGFGILASSLYPDHCVKATVW